MEIHSLNYSVYKMYNPTTGDVIIDEECDDDALSLKGYWLGGFLDEPVINDEKLKAAWEAFIVKFDTDSIGSNITWDALDKFLEAYDSLEWIGYKITSYGIACGPVSSTVVYIVDKDVIVEDSFGNEMVNEDNQ